jgi:iron complex outermembrane receptor protein
MNSPSPQTHSHLRPTPASVRALIAFTIALTLGATLSVARAQTAPSTATPPATAAAAKDDPIMLQAFVSTGTRFSDRTVIQSPVPIDVITSAEMQQGGYTETSQMLQALVPSFNFPRPSLTDGTDHIRPATLRGLAPDQALVLVNGKRRHTSALVNVNGSIGRGSVSADFNAIPSSAIGRVEVLRDGASAQYGSDAIAGVINVILRKDAGWGFDATYGATKEGDGRDLKLSASAGTRLGSAGSLFVTVFGREHSPTNRSVPDTRQQYFGRGTGGALTAISGNFGSGTGLSAPSGTLDPRESSVNRLNHRYGDPRLNERGLFLNGETPLGGYTAYFFGGGTRRHGEGAGFARRSGDDRTVRAIWPDGFLPMIQSNIHDLSLGGGLRGRVAGGWDMDVSSVIGSNELAYTTAQSNNVTLGTASPRSFYSGTLTFKQHTTNLDLTNRYNLTSYKPLKVAAGGEFRHEHYNIRPGTPDSYRDGGVRILDGPSAGAQGAPGAQVFPGFRPTDAGAHTRDSYAFYVDLEQEFSDRWMISAAGRFEDYSDFGNETTWKLATRFQLAPPVALRASVSTGFRAPHLAQQWFSSTATNFIGGVPFENKTFPVTDPVARALGAQPLKPETSLNESVGLTWQPIDVFSSSVDFYQIEIDDRVVLSSNFTGAAGSPFLAYLNSQGLFGTTGGRYFTNAVDTRTRGVDLNARYVWRLAQGQRVTFTAGANFNKTEVTRFKPTPPQLAAVGVTTPLFDLTERIRMEKGQPKSILNLAAVYDLGPWSFLARAIRYGDVEAVQFSSITPAQIAALTPGIDSYLMPTDPATANSQLIQRYKAKWITDLDVTFRATRQLSLSIGANNVFDILPHRTVPSRIANGTVFNGADNAGSLPFLLNPTPYGFNGAFYYGKVSWKY